MKLRKGHAKYRLPDDIYQIESVTVNDAKALYLHHIIQVREMVKMDSKLVGPPHYFYIEGGKICFQPTPNRTYTVTIRYTTIKEI
jgi:hypothetical protein